MKQITIEDIKIPKPDFAASKTPKGQLISSWLIDLIKHLLECGLADVGDFLPTKEDFAKYLDVSTATMQISIRQVKNLGYLNSKQSIGTYIADFYSAGAKLVIELDGSGHYTEKGKKYDEERTAFLQKYGLTVVRISNTEIHENFEGVCNYIHSTVVDCVHLLNRKKSKKG